MASLRRGKTLDDHGSSMDGAIQAMAGAVIVLAVGLFSYYLWDNWWVNWDGGFYLYLGKSIHEGNGLTFPDGSPAYFRGPGYPGLFAIGWSFLQVSAKTAIWMSRAVLLGVGVLVSLMIARARIGWAYSAVAGLAALTPSIVLESGGWYFVPDGLAAGLVIAALALTAVADEVGWIHGLSAGLVMGLAALTKETAFLYVPIVLLVLWARTRRGDPASTVAAGAFILGSTVSVLAWVLWATARVGIDLRFIPIPVPLAVAALALVATFAVGAIAHPSTISRRFVAPSPTVLATIGVPVAILGSFAALWAFGEPLVLPLSAGFPDALSRLAVSFGWSWVPAVIVIVGAAVARPPRRHAAALRLWLAGWLLVAIGVGQAWYAASAALSMRNAVAGIFGLALLLAVTLFTTVQAGRLPVKILSWLIAVAFVGLAAFTTGELDLLREDRSSWDNSAVYELRAWLNQNEIEAVRISPIYATYTWFLGGDLPDPTLLEMHGAPAGIPSYDLHDFCKRVWWGGDIPSCPSTDVLRTAAANRRIVSSVFADAFGREPQLSVLTGNLAAGSAFDADVLVYMIEVFDLGEPVFATSETHLPHWAIAYELDQSQWSDPALPAVVEPGLEGIGNLVIETIEFDREEFETVLRAVLP